jgi:hypothetical protein
MCPSQQLFRRGAAALFAAWAALGIGCSDSPAPPSDEPPGTGACVAGELVGDAGCVPAGLPPDLRCAPGEMESEGGCRAAGVAPEDCGEGFVSDGARGCYAVIPASCPKGQMAVPGDETCRPVAPCAPGKWGSIPTDASTQHVDQSYAGAAPSDGSASAPWKTVQEGIDHASEQAIVAVAAGTYFEDLIIDAPVVLWGVCPDEVTVSGSSTATAAVQVSGGDGEIRDLAITGDSHALLVSNAQVLVDRVWVHDVPGLGPTVQDTLGASRLDLQRSLVEHVGGAGAYALGSEMSVVASAFRDGVSGYAGLGGVGLFAQINPKTGRRAVLEVTGSVVEDNRDMGIASNGADVAVDTTLIRRMSVGVMGYGRAVQVGVEPVTLARGTLQLERSVIEDAVELGVAADGGDAVVRSSTVRRVETGGGLFARGIGAVDHVEAGRCNLTVIGSLVDRAAEAGLTVTGCDARIEATVVRGSAPAPAPPYWGWGIHIEGSELTGQRSVATVIGSVVEQTLELGIDVFAADATIESTLVRDIVSAQRTSSGIAVGGPVEARGSATVRAAQVERAHGGMLISNGDAVIEQSAVLDCVRGVNVQKGSTATVRALSVERAGELGVYVGGSHATLEALSIREVSSNAEGRFGDGIAVLGASADVSISRTRVEASQRAALLNAGAAVAFGDSAFMCSGFDLEGEPWDGTAYRYQHLGGTVCGCGERVDECQILSGGLEPPAELDTPQRYLPSTVP